MKSLINTYKRYRKYQQLSKVSEEKYAFVGIGNHSINNLYPVIDYLHIQLKYIVTGTQKTADILNASHQTCEATVDYDMVLNDPEIKGIFISAAPTAHYKLIKKALEHNKHVFVEKPPCSNSEELHILDALQKKSQKTVLVGLQRRYAPAYAILKKKASGIQHYNLKYVTGAYPEGNPVMDLYIHPLDIVSYLFGEANVKSILETKDTKLIQLTHNHGIIGSLELSTAYSWQGAKEQLTAVSHEGIYELNNLSELLFTSKPGTAASIPLEKVMKYTPKTTLLFNQNMFLPTFQHNNLYVGGYYSEIESFISCCEKGSLKENHSGLESLRATYTLLSSICK